jgi:hypothetical protein
MIGEWKINLKNIWLEKISKPEISISHWKITRFYCSLYNDGLRSKHWIHKALKDFNEERPYTT